MNDATEQRRCQALFRAYLRRALDDLNALLAGKAIPNGDTGRQMTQAEREQLLMETLEWFLNETDSSACSLNTTCDILNLNAVDVRAKALALAHGEIQPKIRRYRLSPSVRQYVLDELSRGATTRELGRQIGVNPATIRKIRIKHRRQLANTACRGNATGVAA